jgi:hypothetical protein
MGIVSHAQQRDTSKLLNSNYRALQFGKKIRVQFMGIAGALVLWRIQGNSSRDFIMILVQVAYLN